jgi:AcrR family transcriptional regulator
MSKAPPRPAADQEAAGPGAPAAPRKRARPGATELQTRRRDLLAATRKLLSKGGTTTVTMRAVADMVGMSTTVVYAMFPDKAALIAHALDDDLKRFSRHLQQALHGAGDARDALMRVAQAYVAFGVAHPQSYRLMFMEPRPAMPVADMAGEHGNPRQQAYDLACGVAAGLLRELADGTPAPGAVDATAQLLWEALHGITSLRITLEADPWFERIPTTENVQRMVQVLLAGLKG